MSFPSQPSTSIPAGAGPVACPAEPGGDCPVPPQVIRGTSTRQGNKTKVDYLTITCEDNEREIRRCLSDVFASAPAEPKYLPGPGMRFFSESQRIAIAGIPSGVVLTGGETQRGKACIDLWGAGCGLVADWDRAEDALLSLPERSWRRADIAADFFRGEVSHERVTQAHADGKFMRGGRSPVMREILSSDETEGRTIYIGKRGGDSLGRFYEKGKEQFWSHSNKLLRRLGGIEGVSITDEKLNSGESFNLASWYRAELELRAKNRPIPEDWISRRDEYYAGAYPFMAELLPEVEGRILFRPKHLGILAIERMLDTVKKQWGPSLYTGLAYLGGDYVALALRIVGERHSARLIEAGALLAIEGQP